MTPKLRVPFRSAATENYMPTAEGLEASMRSALSPKRRLVPLERLRATQETVDAGRVRHYMRKGWKGNAPTLYKQGEHYSIVDGHHRMVAAAMRGRKRTWVNVVTDNPHELQKGLLARLIELNARLDEALK